MEQVRARPDGFLRPPHCPGNVRKELTSFSPFLKLNLIRVAPGRAVSWPVLKEHDPSRQSLRG
jgi:hypothetical protein